MSALTYTDPAGMVWHKYTCSFESPDGSFAFDLWAISDDHAQLQLASLKESAVVDGRLAAEIPWKEPTP